MNDEALIADLLGRPEDCFEVSQPLLKGKTILVTGGAGSIGSQLCRSLLRCAPARLVVLDRSEERLAELTRNGDTIAVELADIRDPRRMYALFASLKPDLVFHAAAFKHVALLEQFPFEAILNNTLATIQLADLAEEFGTGQFVFISTDKAVDPRSVMGLSKRLAELFLVARRNSPVAFATLRCGNVLGSSGSVLPIWLAELTGGKPLPITEPDAKRYFVSGKEISGALRSLAAVGNARGLFTYALHEPIAIGDLARRLSERIKPGAAFESVTTGLQGGEKLHEELLAEDETAAAFLPCPGILTIQSASRRAHNLTELQGQLQRACRDHDLETLVEAARSFVPTYLPSASLLAQNNICLVKDLLIEA